MNCQICRFSEGNPYQVPEMMFGTREVFTYWECARCGCLQLQNPPEDLSRYYPSNYYAFSPSQAVSLVPNPIRRFLKRQRDAAILFGRRNLFSWIGKRYPNPGIFDVKTWLKPTRVRSFRSRILDVGCGQGEILFRLAELGFQSLTGIDPFLFDAREFGHVRLLSESIEQHRGGT